MFSRAILATADSHSREAQKPVAALATLTASDDNHRRAYYATASSSLCVCTPEGGDSGHVFLGEGTANT